jgi:hypothetical protein
MVSAYDVPENKPEDSYPQYLDRWRVFWLAPKKCAFRIAGRPARRIGRPEGKRRLGIAGGATTPVRAFVTERRADRNFATAF